MKINLNKTIPLIALYLYYFITSRKILIFSIIVISFFLIERLLFPESSIFYGFFILIGAIPSLALAIPIKLSAPLSLKIDRRKIVSSFEKSGFSSYDTTSQRVCLRKTISPLLEWNERRVIIERCDDKYEIEVLLCDKVRLSSLLS